MTDLPSELVAYLTARDQQRVDRVRRALATLRPYERRLVREAAVMGYVRGAIAGRSRAALGEPRDGDIPADSAILTEVILGCASMDDLHPYLADAANGRRRRITRARLWPGETARRTPRTTQETP